MKERERERAGGEDRRRSALKKKDPQDGGEYKDLHIHDFMQIWILVVICVLTIYVLQYSQNMKVQVRTFIHIRGGRFMRSLFNSLGL